MQDILIITGVSDIPVAEVAASGLSNYKVLLFDPTLVDTVHKLSLIHI